MNLSDEVQGIAIFYANEGEHDNLLAALQALIPLTHQEPGCLQYDLLIDQDDADVIIMLEKFINKDAFESHCDQPYIKHFIETQVPILCRDFTFHLANPFVTTEDLVTSAELELDPA